MSQQRPDDCPPSRAVSLRAAKPVFFDPASKRWPRLRLGMTLIGLTLSLLLGALVLSILASPVLPALNLPGVSFLPQGAHALPAVPALAPERPLTPPRARPA